MNATKIETAELNELAPFNTVEKCHDALKAMDALVSDLRSDLWLCCQMLDQCSHPQFKEVAKNLARKHGLQPILKINSDESSEA